MLKGIGRSFSADSDFCVVSVCRGKINGRDFYAFIAIEPRNFDHFKNNYVPGEAGNFDEYGRELLRGWGQAPPQDIIDYVRVQHGVNFGVDENFLSRLMSQAARKQFPLKPAISSVSSRTGTE